MLVWSVHTTPIVHTKSVELVSQWNVFIYQIHILFVVYASFFVFLIARSALRGLDLKSIECISLTINFAFFLRGSCSKLSSDFFLARRKCRRFQVGIKFNYKILTSSTILNGSYKPIDRHFCNISMRVSRAATISLLFIFSTKFIIWNWKYVLTVEMLSTMQFCF